MKIEKNDQSLLVSYVVSFESGVVKVLIEGIPRFWIGLAKYKKCDEIIYDGRIAYPLKMSLCLTFERLTPNWPDLSFRPVWGISL